MSIPCNLYPHNPLKCFHSHWHPLDWMYLNSRSTHLCPANILCNVCKRIQECCSRIVYLLWFQVHHKSDIFDGYMETTPASQIVTGTWALLLNKHLNLPKNKYIQLVLSFHLMECPGRNWNGYFIIMGSSNWYT